MNEHDNVVLTVDLPESGLQAEDVGVIVHDYAGGDAVEVEFLALDGSTLSIETLTTEQIRPIRPQEIAHARAVAGTN